LTGKDLFEFLVKNEELIFHAKKSELKKADSIYCDAMYVNDKGGNVSKEEAIAIAGNTNLLKAQLIINTTNWFDSHYDVHIDGLWKKSLSDNKRKGFYLLNSHSRRFEDVISEGCLAEAKIMAWKELGVNLSGSTEALVFTAL